MRGYGPQSKIESKTSTVGCIWHEMGQVHLYCSLRGGTIVALHARTVWRYKCTKGVIRIRNSKKDRQHNVKLRLMMGTYHIQTNRSAFNQHEIDTLCKDSTDDREHFITECTALASVRSKYYREIKKYININSDFLSSKSTIAMYVLNINEHALPQHLTTSNITEIKTLFRKLVFELHTLGRRRRLLLND